MAELDEYTRLLMDHENGEHKEKVEHCLGCYNIIDDIFEKSINEMNTAKAKYEPLVQHLTDMEFAALYTVIMDERTIRMARLMMENPAILQQQLEKLRDIHN